jgi:NhaP-type Na+/H+ or K+/H+ antiporter
MSEYQTMAVIAGFAFAYSMVAARLENTPISGALVFVVFGAACSSSGLGVIDVALDGEMLRQLAEFTLALVLFSDAANANLGVLARFKGIPGRLLLVGLPLTILLGFGVGSVLLGDLGIFEVALLATMLAPTDAALGKAVVTNTDVPQSVREGLNVESGLNDGICVPVLFVFLALAAGSTTGDQTLSLMIRLPAEEIGIGAIVGVACAVVGVYAMRVCVDRNWLTGTWLQIPVIALALLCFAAAQSIGGSGFIAAFIGGLVFGKLAGDRKEHVLEAAEGAGDALALITWVAFGAAVVAPAIANATWPVVLYAVLSLTVVRMLPVFLCLLRTKSQPDTKLFVGWFGPRGLASIVFIVIVAGEHLPGQSTLAQTVAWTIMLSVLAHGLTANPLAAAFAARLKARGGVA